MENIFDQFEEMFNSEELAKSIEKVNANNKPFEKKEVPYGDYEVKLVSLEIGKHEWEDDYFGKPVGKVCFQIINHEELTGQRIYINKKLISLKNPKSGFMTNKFIEFLDSLETSYTPVFENWNQFGALVKSMSIELDGRAEYQLSFFDDKGFKDYAIVKRFQ